MFLWPIPRKPSSLLHRHFSHRSTSYYKQDVVYIQIYETVTEFALRKHETQSRCTHQKLDLLKDLGRDFTIIWMHKIHPIGYKVQQLQLPLSNRISTKEILYLVVIISLPVVSSNHSFVFIDLSILGISCNKLSKMQSILVGFFHSLQCLCDSFMPQGI